jgi:CheY-like chemotaxis protein
VTSVLIVDDHPSFRRFARVLLQASGFTVVDEAADGASALEAARRHRPDVVLLDILLPDTTGFEVADSLARECAAPVVVLTSSRSASDLGPSLERSRARFIAKCDLSGPSFTALLDGAA